MEFKTQPSNASPPYGYVTAPTSPNEHTSMESYYSAPATPRSKTCYITAVGDDNLSSSTLDDFEFETSKKFSSPLDCDTGDDNSECDDDEESEQKYHREHGGSLPAMAFADELFLNGLVMPLKLPPRLQYDSDHFNSFSQKSPVFTSPRMVCRLPFGRNSWNDDFDPFMVALQKVREEKRGRNSVHRRSRSYSPFRAMSKSSSYRDQENIPMEKTASKYSGPLDFKGSAYARFVIDQTREGLNPKSPNRFFIGPLKPERPEKEKPISSKGKYSKKKCGDVEESTVQKVKGFLMRYASFGKENSGDKAIVKASSEAGKLSYFSRLSFKFKGNSSKKRMVAADTKKAVVQYKPSFTLCLGYGAGTPRMIK